MLGQDLYKRKIIEHIWRQKTSASLHSNSSIVSILSSIIGLLGLEWCPKYCVIYIYLRLKVLPRFHLR